MRTLVSLLSFVAVTYCFIVPPLEDEAYADAVARSDMLPLAAAAYSKKPDECLTKVFGGQLKRQVTVKCDLARDSCSGYTALLPKNNAIVVSFRGTDRFLQLITESNQAIFKDKIVWPAGGKVSKYFYDAFMDVWTKGMKDDFLSLKNANPTYQVWVTGHSLGGAMASLAASYIVTSGMVPASKVHLYTFGQPRTGDKDWSSAHDGQNMVATYRVTHWRDVVPHVPPEHLEGYRHHKFEAFYKSHMKEGAPFTVCTGDEDNKCSDGLDITTSIEDHLHYFEKDISEWGEKGCK
ncbi:unnamed protein product [Auanema sp. JU1783]|nr:unnamed protein product [Auanema sp. JU1783]